MVGITIKSVNINGEDRPIESKDDLREIIGLMNFCLKWMPDKAVVSGNGVARPFPNRPPIGERAVDYLLKAAATLGPRFTISELYDAMLAVGWKTKSKRRGIALSQIRSLAKADDNFQTSGDGYWTYTANNDANPES